MYFGTTLAFPDIPTVSGVLDFYRFLKLNRYQQQFVAVPRGYSQLRCHYTYDPFTIEEISASGLDC